jgi:hypothetical protein
MRRRFEVSISRSSSQRIEESVRNSKILHLLAEDNRLNVYAGELDVRPPAALTTGRMKSSAVLLQRDTSDRLEKVWNIRFSTRVWCIGRHFPICLPLRRFEPCDKTPSRGSLLATRFATASMVDSKSSCLESMNNHFRRT